MEHLEEENRRYDQLLAERLGVKTSKDIKRSDIERAEIEYPILLRTCLDIRRLVYKIRGFKWSNDNEKHIEFGYWVPDLNDEKNQESQTPESTTATEVMNNILKTLGVEPSNIVTLLHQPDVRIQEGNLLKVLPNSKSEERILESIPTKFPSLTTNVSSYKTDFGNGRVSDSKTLIIKLTSKV